MVAAEVTDPDGSYLPLLKDFLQSLPLLHTALIGEIRAIAVEGEVDQDQIKVPDPHFLHLLHDFVFGFVIGETSFNFGGDEVGLSVPFGFAEGLTDPFYVGVVVSCVNQLIPHV